MFTPYRFVELYVRGDIGENLAFVFMPLTLFFIYKIYKKFTGGVFVFLGAISLACLILSHNAISLMYLPFIIFYCAYLIFISKHKKFLLLNSCFLILLGFVLSAFFWLPGLLEGKYTLRNLLTMGDYKNRFISFTSLIYSPWNYDVAGRFTKQLGVANWIILIVSLFDCFIVWKRKDKSFLLIIALILYTIIAIFLMLPYSRFIWDRITLLQNFQFPWRFLAVPVFTTSILGGFAVSSLRGGTTKQSRESQARITNNRIASPVRQLVRNDIFLIFVLTAVILFLNKDFWHAKGYLYQSDNFFSGIYNGTTDTGESSPLWSTRFMEHRFTAPLQLISGNAAIKQVQRTTTKHVYLVDASTEAQFVENTVYFPGWEISVDKIPVSIQYQDTNNRGLMTFFVPKGTHIVRVQDTETKLRILADVISLSGVLVIFVILTTNYITKKMFIPYTK